jgi:membrane protein implicated in regulation of membrane protease activity
MTAPAPTPAPATAPATAVDTGSPVSTARQVAGRRWRRARGVLFAVFALIVVVVVLAALQPRERPQDLDPESARDGGSRALVQVLGRNGTPVTISRAVSGAADAMRANPDAVLVVVRTERLTGSDLDTLRALPGNLLLVSPTQAALAALTPQVRQAEVSVDAVVPPRCAIPAATRSGDVDFGFGTTYQLPPGAAGCYAFEGNPHVVQLSLAGRVVTVVGSSFPFVNGGLTEKGNAALAMNLVGARSSAVWLMPALPPPGAAGEKSFADLVPPGVKLAIVQLIIAVGLIALWRARRLGPVVAEPLPVVVRSAEAVEGRARLYRARRARDRAADALRAGARERLVPLLGLPSSAAQDMSMAAQVVAAVADRTDQHATAIGPALYGPPPLDDAELVALADYLDNLEGQVRQW